MPQIDSSHSSSLRSRLWGSVKRKCERGREREGGEEGGKGGQRRPSSGPEDSALTLQNSACAPISMC